MYYVLVNIGCLECYLGSAVVGIYTDREEAIEARSQSPLVKNPSKAPLPDRSLQIFEVTSLDTTDFEALKDF